MAFTRRILIIALAFGIIIPAFAQDEDIFGIDRKLRTRTRKADSDLGNAFRNVLGSFSFELMAGGGLHHNRMNFTSQQPSDYPIRSVLSSESLDIGPQDTLSFIGSGHALPLQAAVKLSLFDLLVVGGGYGREWGGMDALGVQDYRFPFEHTTYTFDKLYGSVGLVLYDAGKRRAFLNWRYRRYSGSNHYMQSERKLRMQQNYPWRFMVDGEFGRLFLRQSYDTRLTADRPFYSVGFRVEKEFSEYTKMFIRPAMTIRQFGYNPGLESGELQTIQQQLYTLQFGVAVRLPSTKRCKVPGCGVVMKHIHNGVEYRGSSIWRMQNRKVGQWYGN